MKEKPKKKINVGVAITKKELDEMKSASKVDSNGPSVLAMARKGLEVEKQGND